MVSIEKYIELRRLIDVLYDIQDVRMRTASRLRQMPKDSIKIYVGSLLKVEYDITNEIEGLLSEIPIYTEFLYKVRGVGPRISGSIIAQTMIKFERISKKTYEKISHGTNENQNSFTSQASGENQIVTANQRDPEAKNMDVSQIPLETQDVHAKYGREQLKLAQKTDKGDYLIPVIRGIGQFDTVSKYWAWWGLHVIDGKAAKRVKGQNINWNPKMKSLAWKIGKQFVMQGDEYKKIYKNEKDRLAHLRLPLGKCHKYDDCKNKLKKREKPACKGHINNMAKRKAVKIFISHLWEVWRKLEGLQVTEPYAIEKLGHKTKIEPTSG